MMGRSSYIGRDENDKAIWVETGSPEHLAHLRTGTSPNGPAIFGDEGEFVSPIDRKTYSGKAGMREHNKRHDVINNRDLAGLPYQTTASTYVPDRKAIRTQIIETMRSKGML